KLAVKHEKVHELLVHETPQFQRRMESVLLPGTEGRLVLHAAALEVEVHDYGEAFAVHRQPQLETALVSTLTLFSKVPDLRRRPMSCRAGQRCAEEIQGRRFPGSVWHLDQGDAVRIAARVAAVDF